MKMKGATNVSGRQMMRGKTQEVNSFCNTHRLLVLYIPRDEKNWRWPWSQTWPSACVSSACVSRSCVVLCQGLSSVKRLRSSCLVKYLQLREIECVSVSERQTERRSEKKRQRNTKYPQHSQVSRSTKKEIQFQKVIGPISTLKPETRKLF